MPNDPGGADLAAGVGGVAGAAKHGLEAQEVLLALAAGLLEVLLGGGAVWGKACKFGHQMASWAARSLLGPSSTAAAGHPFARVSSNFRPGSSVAAPETRLQHPKFAQALACQRLSSAKFMRMASIQNRL